MLLKVPKKVLKKQTKTSKKCPKKFHQKSAKKGQNKVLIKVWGLLKVPKKHFKKHFWQFRTYMKIPQNTRTQILLKTAFTLRCFGLLPDCPYPALLPHKLYILAI